MRAVKTYFEQIPVDAVMKIATRLPNNDLAEEGSVNIETRDEVTSPPAEGWRAVAQQIQQERDPKTMSVLVQKLIAELDEEELRRHGATGRSYPSS
jgi:hypothetical protein